ncbi:unnamed protein product, partial [Didymodactylos carnosus]
PGIINGGLMVFTRPTKEMYHELMSILDERVYVLGGDQWLFQLLFSRRAIAKKKKYLKTENIIYPVKDHVYWSSTLPSNVIAFTHRCICNTTIYKMDEPTGDFEKIDKLHILHFISFIQDQYRLINGEKLGNHKCLYYAYDLWLNNFKEMRILLEQKFQRPLNFSHGQPM